MSDWTIGIIGGSGLYAIDALEDPQWIAVQSPWGDPSDEILCGTIGHVRVRFLPRHGRGHRIAPSTLDSRANIDALKRAGCTDILAVSAVGSLSEELAPGRFVTVDQFIDNTKGRPSSFFGDGFVAHVSMADPVCDRLSRHAAKAVAAAGGECTEGATYLAMEGPQFSTRAESRLYRHWGAEVIGMTGMPEARLAREAELPYALLAMVTDYDCWRDETEAVDVGQVLDRMQDNARLARETIEAFCKALPRKRTPSPIDHALDNAVVTAPEARDKALMTRLDAVVGRVIRQQ
ncbi:MULTISPECIES: S-methyl-5'-thioadenosine phosphorylase [unclassified Erythrobacter]|jgi:5'-methylthioadenosine phosphorylase|uniref:S-methyl-5'-thioadenosine phosphorylase n=1 Tax=Erythrobacteraceae TaxID=335929 RepID=UPI0007B8AA8E|nr:MULTISPECIES: S-methyl-5'-thioadenosine phosphorylase [unclassified Erythrobacter]RZP20436.1 MAG: S-methyl-5'-thioadenosine phosphorylase [Erythrobacter sp.]KZY93632.1 5'-methylthioadenosine phosphorylase [Erythrobacter sp. HI0074]KZZ08297.1 5'-methylthioadenosine phosphorylase [Erythrobacter sp. HI0077]HAN88557.1 S-methyl-5'-thioadenosine phosphorylase [Erythrobacter sp.]HAV80210.1 S-methyl-5'-thioadenosine phosphorylase [Erythrobacter sp.]|tara:strand:- start:91 stop:963 length:873 start_codon:yes stop_codon:yes gene_type:complete